MSMPASEDRIRHPLGISVFGFAPTRISMLDKPVFYSNGIQFLAGQSVSPLIHPFLACCLKPLFLERVLTRIRWFKFASVVNKLSGRLKCRRFSLVKISFPVFLLMTQICASNGGARGISVLKLIRIVVPSIFSCSVSVMR
jgi:hypothetical protein